MSDQPLQPNQPVDPYQNVHAEAGQPLPQGAAPVQPQTPQKKAGFMRRLLTGLISLVLLIGVGSALAKFLNGDTSEDKTMAVGTCDTITKGSSDKESDTPKVHDCNDATVPLYKVVQKAAGTTCEGDYVAFQYSSSRDKDKPRSTYCMMPVLKADTCYQSVDKADTMVGETPVACSDSKAEYKVTKVLDGVADTSKCISNQGVAFGIDPKTTYCIAKPS